MHLLHLPLPSLVFLRVAFENPHSFENSFKSFPNFSPNIRELFIYVHRLGIAPFNKIEHNYHCRWRNLCCVVCPRIALDRDALVDLSRVPALTRLECALSATFSASDSTLFFSNLHNMKLHSASLEPTSRLLSQIRLPAITNFTAIFRYCPSKQEFSSFMIGVQVSSASNTVEKFGLIQSSNAPRSNSEAPLLGLKDLRLCMEFSNLRFLHLNIEYNVGLTESEVLELASAWPRMEHLSINDDWGWNSQGGVTPGGLVRLLQTCRSLRSLDLLLDTRGYTDLPSSQAAASLELTLTPTFSINVLDSIIEADSLPAIAAFFSGIAACTGSFFLLAWIGRRMPYHPNSEEYEKRWEDVKSWVKESRSVSSDSDRGADVTSLE